MIRLDIESKTRDQIKSNDSRKKTVYSKTIKGLIEFMDAYTRHNFVHYFEITLDNGNMFGGKGINAIAEFYILTKNY